MSEKINGAEQSACFTPEQYVEAVRSLIPGLGLRSTEERLEKALEQTERTRETVARMNARGARAGYGAGRESNK